MIILNILKILFLVAITFFIILIVGAIFVGFMGRSLIKQAVRNARQNPNANPNGQSTANDHPYNRANHVPHMKDVTPPKK